MINIGAYKEGSNRSIDFAIEKIDLVNEFLRQSTEEKFTFEESVSIIKDIFSEEEGEG